MDGGGRDRGAVLAAALEELTRGPRSVDALRRVLVDRGVETEPGTLLGLLRGEPRTSSLPDGTWVSLPSFADDLVLTHRLSADECRLEVVGEADVQPWARLAVRPWPLAAGGEVLTRPRARAPGLPRGCDAALCGPVGWLAGFAGGDLVGLRLRGGLLHVERVEEPLPASWRGWGRVLVAAALAHLSDPLTRRRPGGAASLDGGWTGLPLGSVVLAARRGEPDLLRCAVPPVSEVLMSSGEPVEVWRGYVGVAGVRWVGEPVALDEQTERWLLEWAALLARGSGPGGGGPPGPAELVGLARGLVQPSALACAAEQAESHPERAEGLAEAMTRALSGPQDRSLRAVPAYLGARAAEGRGDAIGCERWLRRAVAEDPGNRLAVRDLAEVESARGRADEAHRLHEQAGTPGGLSQVAVLSRFLPTPGERREHPDARPLSERAPWLYAKVVEFAIRPRQRQTVFDFADVLTAGGTRGDARAATRHVVVRELAVFEGGLLGRFLAERGPLLPDDERALAQSWLRCRLRVLEVRGTSDSGTVRLADLSEATRFDIAEPDLALRAERLDLVCCRPLPDGAGGWRLSEQAIALPRPAGRQLARLLADDARPEQVAAWFARVYGPLPWRGIPGLGPDDTLGPEFPTVKRVGRAGLATVEELDALERNWCTTPFEPLGGRTHTQAAADRAMRAELGHVLDDMEWLQRHGAVPAMNTSRLRRRLGLT